MVNNAYFCASEIMRSRTAYQIDPCTASAVDAERKYICWILRLWQINLFSSIFLYLRIFVIHYVGTPASLFTAVYQPPLNYD